MIKALFKFAKIPDGCIVIDTTSSSGKYRELSPFVLPVINNGLIISKNFENLWQFSKVYKRHIGADGEPTSDWHSWRRNGWRDNKAHRYPMGKGTIPEYSYWFGEHLDYIQARKRIYAKYYSLNVVGTPAYKELQETFLLSPHPITLLDYDAYDHRALGMTLKDVINNPKRKMGHAFVLIMMLTDLLEECLGPVK